MHEVIAYGSRQCDRCDQRTPLRSRPGPARAAGQLPPGRNGTSAQLPQSPRQGSQGKFWDPRWPRRWKLVCFTSTLLVPVVLIPILYSISVRNDGFRYSKKLEWLHRFGPVAIWVLAAF